MRPFINPILAELSEISDSESEGVDPVEQQDGQAAHAVFQHTRSRINMGDNVGNEPVGNSDDERRAAEVLRGSEVPGEEDPNDESDGEPPPPATSGGKDIKPNSKPLSRSGVIPKFPELGKNEKKQITAATVMIFIVSCFHWMRNILDLKADGLVPATVDPSGLDHIHLALVQAGVPAGVLKVIHRDIHPGVDEIMRAAKNIRDFDVEKLRGLKRRTQEEKFDIMKNCLALLEEFYKNEAEDGVKPCSEDRSINWEVIIRYLNTKKCVTMVTMDSDWNKHTVQQYNANFALALAELGYVSTASSDEQCRLLAGRYVAGLISMFRIPLTIKIDEVDDCGQDTYRHNWEDYSVLARKSEQQHRLHSDYSPKKWVQGEDINTYNGMKWNHNTDDFSFISASYAVYLPPYLRKKLLVSGGSKPRSGNNEKPSKYGHRGSQVNQTGNNGNKMSEMTQADKDKRFEEVWDERKEIFVAYGWVKEQLREVFDKNPYFHSCFSCGGFHNRNHEPCEEYARNVDWTRNEALGQAIRESMKGQFKKKKRVVEPE